jgi:hypothetical protein
MSSAASNVLPFPLARPSDFLGPGRVMAVAPHEVEVEIRSGERVSAQMALSIPYSPQPGDILLVIGKGEDHYVIGVLHGTGKTSLAFQGAVDLRAEGGPLTLSSDQGVIVRGPEIEVETGKLRMFAGAVVQKFTSVYQRVRESLNVHAGQAHTIVDDRSFLTAKNASIVTEEAMSINGKEIHLG